MKKLLSLLILLTMMVSLLPIGIITSSAVDEYPVVTWNSGMFVGSVYNSYGLKTQYGASSSFAATEVFTVPKAGTKLTWVDTTSGYASNSVLVISSWKKDTSNNWVLDLDGANYAGTSGSYASSVSTKSSTSGVTYTYITSVDNENLRLCYNRGTGTVHPTVTFTATTQAGSWATTLAQKITEVPVPKTKSLGFDLNAETITTEWYYGYVGSSTQSSAPYAITNGSILYLYSDVVTIEKAGTTIYFFDDTQTDGGASAYASTSAFVFSHWSQSGNIWVIDKTKDNRDGATADTAMVGNFKMYYYTTIEDNENLRLCYRAGNADIAVEPTIYPIYISEPYIEFTSTSIPGKLTDQSIKKSDETVLNYKIYLPEDYNSANDYKLIYNVGSDLSLVNAAIEAEGTMIIASFDGNFSESGEMLEFIVNNYAVNQNYIYLTGDSLLDDAYLSTFTASLENASSFDTPLDALRDLLSNKPTFYNALNGITMYALGDSYFQGAGIGSQLTWPSLLATKYNMEHINYGIGGNTIAYYTDVNTTTQLPMCDRYKTMVDDADTDIILLEGGRNDRSKKVPFGTNDSTDTNTFKGALNVTISGLLEKYPDALIICVTAWNYIDSTGATDGYAGTTAEYAAQMVELVEYLNNDRVVCFNAADKELSGVDMNDSSFKAEYGITPTDISHLNPAGMELILPNFEKFIAEQYMQYIGYTEPEEKLDFLIDEFPDTTAPMDTTITPDDTTTLDNEQNGCSCSGGSAFISLAAIITGFGLLVLTKKKY